MTPEQRHTRATLAAQTRWHGRDDAAWAKFLGPRRIDQLLDELETAAKAGVLTDTQRHRLRAYLATIDA
jgi:hypothetical protein